jgi:hypothetical protein
MRKQRATLQEGDLGRLYVDFLRAFYEEEDLARAERIAKQVEAELARRPDLADSIRGVELRSLICELRGDLESAIKYRQSEIRRIFELHSSAQGTPGWNYVFGEYDYSDISDRIDLLAGLYASMGDHGEAIRLLEESRRFCASHGIPFDGEDLLEAFRDQRLVGSEPTSGSPIDVKLVDKAIIGAYRKFKQSADRILVDEHLSRQFAAEVQRRLPAEMRVLIRVIEEHGGLPRLRRRA